MPPIDPPASKHTQVVYLEYQGRALRQQHRVWSDLDVEILLAH